MREKKDKTPVYAKLLTKSTIKDDVTFFIEPLTIKKFFLETDKRIIPDYQRPYSWEEKNIKALLDDIKQVLEGKHESWFLGPLFTTKETPKSKISSLLDGQQRITTLQIILREASIFSKTIEGLSLETDFPKLNMGLKEVEENCRDCLREIEDGEVYPKFETESTVKKLFHNYIESFEYIESLQAFKKAVSSFEEQVALESKKGSKTAQNIQTARTCVRKFLEDNFDITPINKGVEGFIGYMRSLLNKCWIIEVPLAKDDVSTKIFESLNNRGKSLTLTDKLRYKCLINCKSETNKEKLKTKWKQLYRGLDLCQPKFLKNDEDFFKVFFNTINAKSVSDNDEIIEIFEKKYLEKDEKDKEERNDKKILSFVDECLKVLDFYENILIKNLDEINPFIESFRKEEKSKARSLIQLVKSLTFSDNSRFLLFKVIMEKHEISKNNNNKLLDDLWALVKITFFYESLDKKNSNTIRNNFLKVIEEIDADTSKKKTKWSLQDYYIDKKEEKYNTSRNLLNDVLIANDSQESRFILYLYTYLTEHISLSSHLADQYKHIHVEHLFPVVWQDEWKDKNFSKKNIDDFLETININEFPYLKTEQSEKKTLKIINEIKNKEQLELYTSRQAKQKDTLIQFIGNKWVIHAGSNISASNHSLKEKKEEYKKNHYVKIPDNANKKTGLDLYNDFGYKEIILRSLKIINDIFAKFDKKWNEV